MNIAALLMNNCLIASLCATFSAQVLKVIILLITDKSVQLHRMLETGGMPSSHSAGVSALATWIAMEYGLDSPLFAVTAVFASIIIYDATGVRRAAGKHAEILNDLVTELSHLYEEGKKPEALKTLLGHTYPQVLFGIILGILIGFLFQTTL